MSTTDTSQHLPENRLSTTSNTSSNQSLNSNPNVNSPTNNIRSISSRLDSMQIQSPVESSSSRLRQQNSTDSNDMESNQLESVINNYNRICSQLPQNSMIANNWLQSFYDLMRSEWTRLRTYTARHNSKWSIDYVTAEELANAGFFFLNGDRVQCAFCRGIVSGWEPDNLWPKGDRPLAEHARHFPRCPFIMEEDVGNIPIGSDPMRGPKRIGHDVCGNMTPMSLIDPVLSSIAFANRSPQPVDMREYGVQPHRGPKNPSYKSIDSRRSSYQSRSWANTVPVSADALAEAGFYSVGMGDYVRCFYCDGGLWNWECGDDPWVEHAKFFPDCQFVQLNKSQIFIEECKRMVASESSRQSNGVSNASLDPEIYSSSSSDSEDENSDALAMRAVNEWMNADIVIQLIDLNAFPIDIIKAVLNRRWFEERQPFASFAQLYDAVSQWKSQPIVQNSQPLMTGQTENSEELHSSLGTSNEECVSNPESVPSSQSSLSSTTSSLSPYSSSPESEKILSNSESESMSKSDDNRLLCKICLDREIGVVFLPCGHQLACTQCAPCVTDCPICRKVIRGTVRTFFS